MNMNTIEESATSTFSAKEDRDDLLVYKSIDIKQLSRIKLFGIPIDNVTRDEALSYIFTFLEKKKTNRDGPYHVLLLDPIKLIRITLQKRHCKIAKKAQLVLTEGGGLRWITINLDTPIKERIPIISLIMDLMRLAVSNEFTVYFLGSRREYLEKVFFNFQRSFPGIRIIGRQEGYFGHEREALVKESLRKSAPDLILLSMEFLKQQQWIQENKSYLVNSVVVGIDDSFEILSGLDRRRFFTSGPSVLSDYGKVFPTFGSLAVRKRSPHWIQTRGFTWLWYGLTRFWRLHDLFLIISFYMVAVVSVITSLRAKRKQEKHLKNRKK